MVKIVEAQMLGAPGGDRKLVGANRVTVFKKNCDRNVGVCCGSVQDAARLMAGHLRGGTVALAWDISLGNGPSCSSSRRHDDKYIKHIDLRYNTGLPTT